ATTTEHTGAAPVPPALLATPVPPPPAGPLLPGQKVFARELKPSPPQTSSSVAAQAAISVPSTGGRTGIYWVGCAAATGLALGLFLVFARRHRAPEPISLITRSLERDRK